MLRAAADAGNKVKRRGEGGADASPMRNRKGKNAKGDKATIDITKAMAAVYFSYEPDPEAMAEADPEEQALVQQEAASRAEAAARQRKKREQMKLDAALLKAAAPGHAEAVKLLLEFGADANLASNSGFTPLIVAAAFGHAEVVTLILAAGADREAVLVRVPRARVSALAQTSRPRARAGWQEGD